jgi:hypothetical protein
MGARPFCLGEDRYTVAVQIIDRWECPSLLTGCLVHGVAHVPPERRFQAVATTFWPTHQHRRDDGSQYERPIGSRRRWVYGATAEEARYRLWRRREDEGWAHYPAVS